MSDQGLSLYVDWCNEYWGGSPDEDRMLDAARRLTMPIVVDRDVLACFLADVATEDSERTFFSPLCRVLPGEPQGFPVCEQELQNHRCGPGLDLVPGACPVVAPLKGDHVVLSWNPHCGHCFYCDRGLPILCEDYLAKGPQAVQFDGHR